MLNGKTYYRGAGDDTPRGALTTYFNKYSQRNYITSLFKDWSNSGR